MCRVEKCEVVAKSADSCSLEENNGQPPSPKKWKGENGKHDDTPCGDEVMEQRVTRKVVKKIEIEVV